MPRKIRELRADLRRAGYVVDRIDGSHTIWTHPLVPGHVSISGHDGSDAKPYQERAVREALQRAAETTTRQEP